jgi:chaperonin GroES
VGTGRLTNDGQTVPMEIKNGDRVLFGKFAGQTVKLDNVEYHILKEDDVMAVLN